MLEVETTPAAVWELDATKRALDELFTLSHQYKTKESYHELMKFVACFRFYSPFNAMLIHIQMPGATFVAPPYRWLRDYLRQIRLGARPLVILQPMGPVMFVFDVSDTDPMKDAPPLPKDVENPFGVASGNVGGKLGWAIENARRDGIRVEKVHDGSQSAGRISPVGKDIQAFVPFQVGRDEQRKPIYEYMPVKYDLLINKKHSDESQYATIVHELAHLYCGHLGTPNDRWWPDRRGMDIDVMEFEAESVSYLVCARAGIENKSEQYLSGYVGINGEVPSISLECVMKAAGLVETMSKERMKPREKPKVKTRG